MENNKLKDIIKLAQSGNSSKLKEAVNTLLSQKLANALETKKSDVRKASLTGVTDESKSN